MASTRKKSAAKAAPSAAKQSATTKAKTGARRAPRNESGYSAGEGGAANRSKSARARTAPFSADVRKSIDSAVAEGRELRRSIEKRIQARLTGPKKTRGS